MFYMKESEEIFVSQSGSNRSLTENNIKKLIEKTGYQLLQFNSQRIFCPATGPVEKWDHGLEVHVGSLPPHLYEDELYALFHHFGTILQTRIMLNSEGKSRGYAYILYENQEEALEAVRCYSEDRQPLRYLDGRWKLSVSISFDNRRLFLGGIPKDMTKAQITRIVGQICPGLKEIFLYKDWNYPSKNRGFCFVEYTSHNEATYAKSKLKNALRRKFHIDLVVNWADPEPLIDPQRMSKVKKVFIRGLDLSTTEIDVRDAVCRIFNNIYIPHLMVRKNRDYAFINFPNRALAVEGVRRINGSVIGGAVVEAALARPDDRTLLYQQSGPLPTIPDETAHCTNTNEILVDSGSGRQFILENDKFSIDGSVIDGAVVEAALAGSDDRTPQISHTDWLYQQSDPLPTIPDETTDWTNTHEVLVDSGLAIIPQFILGNEIFFYPRNVFLNGYTELVQAQPHVAVLDQGAISQLFNELNLRLQS